MKVELFLGKAGRTTRPKKRNTKTRIFFFKFGITNDA